MINLIEQAKKFSDGARTITAWLNGGADTVSKADAQRRADVCLKCPMNQPGGKVSDAIAAAIRKQVELKNHLQLRVDGEKSLMTCTGCGCVLKLKIWIPIDKLGLDKEELAKFDSCCWMRDEWRERVIDAVFKPL